jgi:endoglucanase
MAKIFSVALICASLVGISQAGVIRMNQLGYYPTSNKVFVLAHVHADSFLVKKVSDNSQVLSAALSAQTSWDKSGELVQQGDLSSLQTEGLYYVEIKDVGRSEPFRISTKAYASAYRDVQRAFFFWRASTDIKAENGGKFARPFGHPDTAVAYHDSLKMGTGATRNVQKGWYDAGDYGKYLVNAGVTMGIMQTFLGTFPQYSGDSIMNIPESGNGRADLLDETRWELEWLLRMQATDGGVYFKITPKNFEAMVLPGKDASKRWVIGKTTASTLDFAGIIAQAARRYSVLDPAFSDSLTVAAEAAYAWASVNNSIAYGQGGGSLFPDVNTGYYGDGTFTDEFFWAKCELWLTTGKATYKPSATGLGSAAKADWPQVWTLGLYSLSLEDGVAPDATLKTAARALIKTRADAMKTQISANPYRLPNMDFNWGSNGGIASDAMNLVVAFQFEKDTSYIRAAAEIADYLLGRNPLSTTYLTGIGNKFPKAPHSRIMQGDGIVDPLPGYVVGGPNESVPTADGAATKLAGCLPASCYADIVGSYATNEIAINWQAPVLALLGSIDAVLGGNSQNSIATFSPGLVLDVLGNGTISVTPQKASYTVGDTLHIVGAPTSGSVFLGWSGALGGANVDTTLVISKDLYIQGIFENPGVELIKNGKFSDSLHYWEASPYIDGTIAAWPQMSWSADSSLNIIPFLPGTAITKVYMLQRGIRVAKGQSYTLEFDAKSLATRPVTGELLGLEGQLATFAVTVGPNSFSHYRVSFSISKNMDENVTIRFFVGADTAWVAFDNVSLKLITGTKPGDIVTDIKTPQYASPLQGSMHIQGRWLQVQAPTGEGVAVRLFGLDGSKLGELNYLAGALDRVDLSSLVGQFRGVAVVRVKTSHINQSARWVHEGR